jgi:hypothetical protein
MNNKAKLLVLPIIHIAALTVMIVSASPFVLHQQQSIAQQQQQQQQSLSNQTTFDKEDLLKTYPLRLIM